jgi:hypothetical protein
MNTASIMRLLWRLSVGMNASQDTGLNAPP